MLQTKKKIIKGFFLISKLKFLNFLSFSLALVLPGCGYHYGHGISPYDNKTICVPFVEGDDKGILTAALIRQLAIKGGFIYQSYSAALRLDVCLLPPEDQMIGFAYGIDRRRRNHTKVVVSNEARTTLAAVVNLIDQRTGQQVLGPIELKAFIEYDFEPDLGQFDFHAFSLGQLEMHNLAQDAAFCPLYNILAEKIVDYLVNTW